MNKTVIAHFNLRFQRTAPRITPCRRCRNIIIRSNCATTWTPRRSRKRLRGTAGGSSGPGPTRGRSWPERSVTLSVLVLLRCCDISFCELFTAKSCHIMIKFLHKATATESASGSVPGIRSRSMSFGGTGGGMPSVSTNS